MTRYLPLLILVTVGIVLGIGLFTFFYAKGASYLSNDPAACANCHIMNNHYSAWMKSSHRSVATCNNCHAPASLIPKYWTKFTNGWRHSVAFTTGNFHEPIQITPKNFKIAEANCRTCHQPMVENIEAHTNDKTMSCTRCHGSVGHSF